MHPSGTPRKSSCRPRHGGGALPSGGLAQLALLTALLWVCAGCGTEPTVDAGPRHLILVVIDTLRPDYLGSYGGSVPTPFLDELAASGVRFERNYSQVPMTGPSHASIFTGGLPFDHGCLVNSQTLDPQNETLAEILSARGYATAGFVSLGVLRGRFGFDQGFDVYSDSFGAVWWKSANAVNRGLQQWLSRRSTDAPTFLFLHYSDPHTPYAPPNETYPLIELKRGDEVVAGLRTDSRPVKITLTLQPGDNDLTLSTPAQSDRSALGVGKFAVRHEQITVTFDDGDGDGFRGRRSRDSEVTGLPAAARLHNPTAETLTVDVIVTMRMNLGPDDWPVWYAKEVAWVDSQVALAAAELRQAGLWDDSIIVFTSDHGEGLGQHGNMQHVEQLYDSLLRVPLVIVAPGRIPAGKVVETPVRHMDILPTVLELLDIPATTESRGSSLMPLIDGGATARPPVVSETHRPEARDDQRSVVYEGYKYIINDSSGLEQLYDLSSDPGELRDLAADEPALVEKLRGALATEFGRSYGPGVTRVGWDELSAEEREHLEALGYTR